MSLYARLAAALMIVLAIVAAWWKVDRMFAAAEARGYDRRAAEDKAAAEAQTTRMRELQRAAELRYVVQAEGRDHFFVTTIREIRDAAAPLAACPLPDAVRVRLNQAAQCARGDSQAACGAADEVPGAR